MPRRDARAYLYDISVACTRIAEFTSGQSLADYSGNAMIRSAVERQFEIIGEALNQLEQADPVLAERITDASRIIAFRNRLIYGYATVSDEVVWGPSSSACRFWHGRSPVCCRRRDRPIEPGAHSSPALPAPNGVFRSVRRRAPAPASDSFYSGVAGIRLRRSLSIMNDRRTRKPSGRQSPMKGCAATVAAADERLLNLHRLYRRFFRLRDGGNTTFGQRHRG
jgi:uncharacterized protein with HEPN domain